MNAPTSKRRLLASGILVAGIAVGALLILAAPFGNKSSARAVEIREGGTVVASASEHDAVADASARVGFEIVVPEYVPPGLRLEFVDTALGAEGVPNALKLATLSYGPTDESQRGTLQIRIEQPGLRFSPPDDRAERLDTGLPGVEAYRQVTVQARGYWIFSDDGGFLLTVTGSRGLAEDDILNMLKSLVE